MPRMAPTTEERQRDGLFSKERGDAFNSVIDSIYQGFGGQDLYSTVEEKVANLFYLIVKDHPLSEGKKRLADALFVTFFTRKARLNIFCLTSYVLIVVAPLSQKWCDDS